jgi:hypothetical protein
MVRPYSCLATICLLSPQSITYSSLFISCVVSIEDVGEEGYTLQEFQGDCDDNGQCAEGLLPAR